MALIDRDLIRAVNSGRCFVLIGSGPSCEIGVPSWKELSELAISKVESYGGADSAKQGRELLARGSYPSIFSVAEKVLGQNELLELVRNSLTPKTRNGTTYRYIASWPFSCYLTTNFDDCLIEHLRAAQVPCTMRRNSQEDMRALRADSKNLVMKIHGDPSVPENIVLTRERYLEFQEAASREYWRNKIMSVLNMVDLVIVGYSASDPDFQDQLARAKSIVAPDRPVFLFAAGVRAEKIREYYQQFNIRIISYDNQIGDHRELRRLLRRYDPFIAKRGSPALGLEPVDQSVAELSASMYLFTQMRLIDTEDTCVRKAYSSLILQALLQLPEKQSIDLGSLYAVLVEKTFSTIDIDPAPVRTALETLYSVGYVSFSAEERVTLESRGREAMATAQEERRLIREGFIEACRLFLELEYPTLNDKSVRTVVDALQAGIVGAYQKRGMEIAKSVFGVGAVDVSDASDVLDMINSASSTLSENDERRAFADLLLEVLLRPGEEMRRFVAAIAQGYFAYHALGLDPRCSDERLELAKAKKWILDSSVLLPILACNCLNHLYARDLLHKMKNLGLQCFTTERLFDEVHQHARWAIENFRTSSAGDIDLLQATLAGPGYRQNLFLDGFAKWCQTQGVPSLNAYFTECLGPDYLTDLTEAIRNKVLEWEVGVISFSQWPGFSQDSWVDRDKIAAKIEDLRKRHGTYRGESQCVAEAEVVITCQLDNAAFLSQSGILNRLEEARPQMTMSPEGMYRFLTLFSSAPTGSDLLYQCMIQDFYAAGFDIVNRETVNQFVQPVVRQSRMQLEQQRKSYEDALGKRVADKLIEPLERIPDEQKPFYCLQLAHYVTRQEIAKREAAEARAQQAEKAQSLKESERREYLRLKAKRDEKRRKQLRRKRRSRSRSRKAG